MSSEGRKFLACLERVADPLDLPVLLMACAGKKLYIPQSSESIGPNNWVVKAIGLEKAKSLLGALNEEAHYGCEIAIPFCGGGLLGSVYKMISERVLEGFKAGRPITVIAAECGITRRSVQYHKSRLIAQGEFPYPDEATIRAERYRHSESASAITRVLSVIETDRPSDMDENLSAAFADAATERVDVAPWGDGVSQSREQRALAIIQHVHGSDIRARIAAACKGRRVSLRPSAVISPKHPFRSALDETESRLTALRIVSQIKGKSRLNFRRKVSQPKDESDAAEIRKWLQEGVRPSLIMRKFRVSHQVVRMYSDALDNEIFLKRKLTGFAHPGGRS